MPQLTLEYTANIRQPIESDVLFAQLHNILATTGGIRTDNCKSRAIRLDDFFIGDGNDEHAFIHLSVRFLEGRSPEVIRQVGEQSLEILQTKFLPTNAELKLQITVEIGDIQGQRYFKYPAGTLAASRN